MRYAVPADEATHVYRRESDAQIDCEWWQQVLRLQDWDVKVRIARARDMVLADHAGEVAIDLRGKRAIISLLDPQDYDAADWPQDHERTMVHELLHLHFEPLLQAAGVKGGEEGPAHTAMEQAIHALADALVSLRRRAAKEA